MGFKKPMILGIKCIAIVAITIVASLYSSKLWNEKAEGNYTMKPIVYNQNMTIAEFGKRNSLPPLLLKKIFNLQSPSDRGKTLLETGYSHQQVQERVSRNLVLQAEQGSKNWQKIFIKFGAWFAFLFVMFLMLRKFNLRNRSRILLYSSAVVIFGIILGADPGPMGTIKDAIALYGSKRMIFPPRMIALTVFLIMVIVANKFICSWGCQVGTLQDLFFRINRNAKDKPILRQFRIPFRASNLFRMVFFLLFTVIAVAWSFDIVAPIDPFKIFNPIVLGIIGSISIGLILLASIFVYRPWCHLFCPFGLIAWMLERISIFKIKVNYEKCIACEACSRACPSSVMDAILKQDRIIPDCFSCGSCIESCPVEAISFQAGRREHPPEGKFEQR